MYTTKGIQRITKEAVLERVMPIDIFYYYIPDYKGNQKSFKSDLYNDTNPSCSIKVFRNGDAIYTDFGTGESFDCFSYIQKKFNCSFIDSLLIINADFNLGIGSNVVFKPDPVLLGHSRINKNRKVTFNTVIQIKAREWNGGIDREYWGQYFLTCDILNKYEVIPCSHIWVNGRSKTSKDGNPFYAFKFAKAVYKILTPYTEKGKKWLTNTNQYHLQGYNQLPFGGELLIITKSLKDVMVLDLLGYNAIAPQSESMGIPSDIINLLKKRFKRIIIFYDNDEAGRKGKNKIVYKYGFDFIEIPCEIKDISDYIKEKGKQSALELVNKLTNGT
jgi:hypothetical protein